MDLGYGIPSFVDLCDVKVHILKLTYTFDVLYSITQNFYISPRKVLLTTAYCTGLLLARCATGEDYSAEPGERRRPFRALLDVGALDGGLDIPHSDKRFAGYKKGESTFSVGMLEPTRGLQSPMEDEHDKFQTHFAKYAMRNVEADGLEDFYKVHAAIRADPTATKTEKE
ncbi:hypothetical protein MKW94_008853, partial [Papaver nudicaule]|nr:hypothetical protein [Papaver nudicaule]